MKHAWRRKVLAATLAVSAAAAGSVIASSGAQAEKPPVPPGQLNKAVQPLEASPNGSYIVVLDSAPLIAELGQDQLGTAEAKAAGKAIAKGHDQLLAEVGVPASSKLSSYSNALNGFAAVMSFEQAQVISMKSGVAAVFPNELQQPTTDASGDFLGLSGDAGVWATEATGDGVLVGVIDSGIWPEHPSLDPASFDGAVAHGPLGVYEDRDSSGNLIASYPGCEFGNTDHALAAGLADAAFQCNAKLIGARQVMPAYEALTGLTAIEYDSARDEDGHGTHTATTAAGNAGVQSNVLGVDRGIVSGIAPDAQVAVYKALGELGGYGSDLALAIDIAVADGVDVINYSIGSSSFAIGPDDLAFWFAGNAGVDVATSNGNAGPGAATIGSPASVPWLTSVGASTHDRTFLGTVTVSSDKKAKTDPPAPLSVDGVSITGGTGVLPIVDAADLGNELCLSDVKFKGSVTGKIVLCKRGTNARIDKSYAVYINGGAGMVLYNTFDADTLITDTHWVPSLHVNFTDGSAVKDYIHTAKKPVAQLSGGSEAETQGSVMAAFSSRGENLLSGDLIKPDVTAPGVNILAGNTPTPTAGPPGNLFQSISGTSMSSPHVAGLMALLHEAHPEWSPGAVKSALMTTARQDVTKEDGTTAADPFDMGAGHVDPPSMFDPGLVYASDLFDNAGALCAFGLGVYIGLNCAGAVGAGVVTDDLSDYNQASIASGALPGSQTITREVTNVTGGDLTVTPAFDGLAGISATVEPSTIVVPAGGSAEFTVTFTVTSAALDTWSFGAMTLEGSGYSVRSPIALRPVKLGAPYEVEAELGDADGTSFEVEFGYDGPYTAAGHGLVPADLRADTVDQDPDSTFALSDVGNGATAHGVDVAAGTAFLRVHIPPVANPNTDLDLFVYNPAGQLVAVSGNGGTNETVDIMSPVAGTWTFYVHGWAAGPDTPYVAEVYQISATPGGNMTVVAPDTAVLGTVGTVAVDWPDLPVGPYLGAVSHTTDAGLNSLTLVNVRG
jgi:hypothetical protein